MCFSLKKQMDRITRKREARRRYYASFDVLLKVPW
jgi:hypothetical protein